MQSDSIVKKHCTCTDYCLHSSKIHNFEVSIAMLTIYIKVIYLKSKSGKFYRLLDKGKQKKPKKQKNHKRVDEISLH